MRELTTRRLTPAADGGALNAERTASSMPNSRKAASTESSVKIVRVLRRNNAAQIRWKYFMATSLAVPFSRKREKVPKADEGRSCGVEPTCSSPCPLPQAGEGFIFVTRRRAAQPACSLIQMQRMAGEFCGLRVVGDHDDGLARASRD